MSDVPRSVAENHIDREPHTEGMHLLTGTEEETLTGSKLRAPQEPPHPRRHRPSAPDDVGDDQTSVC